MRRLVVSIFSQTIGCFFKRKQSNKYFSRITLALTSSMLLNLQLSLCSVPKNDDKGNLQKGQQIQQINNFYDEDEDEELHEQQEEQKVMRNSSGFIQFQYICQVQDLPTNKLKVFQVPNTDFTILVVKLSDNTIHAVNSICPTDKAQLDSTLLIGDKVYCPKHGSCYNIRNGMTEFGTQVNGILSFPVDVQGNDVFVRLPLESEFNSYIQSSAQGSGKDAFQTFVVIASGREALMMAKTLRQQLFNGDIIIVTNEFFQPYYKEMIYTLKGEDNGHDIQLKPPEFYKNNRIKVIYNNKIKKILPDFSRIEFEDGSSLQYNKLLYAIGNKPANRDSIKGASSISNVFKLNNLEDLIKIKRRLNQIANNYENPQKGKLHTLAIVGGTHRSLKFAVNLKKKYKNFIDIVLVDGQENLLQNILGSQLAKFFQHFIEKEGIRIKSGSFVNQITGNNTAQGLVLDNGSSLDCETIILMNEVPNTDLISQTIKLCPGPNKGVQSDVFLRTETNDIYTAGNVCCFPHPLVGERINLNSEGEPVQQAYFAALNMLDKQIVYHTIPFMRVAVGDQKAINIVGYTDKADEVIIDGNLEKEDFIAYYYQQNQLVGAASMNRFKEIIVIREALFYGVVPKIKKQNEKILNVEELYLRIQSKGFEKLKGQAYQAFIKKHESFNKQKKK